MCWVALDRAIQIAERVGEREPIARWQQEREKLRAYVATEGWSDRLGAFRQRAEAHNLDSSLLLVPIMRMWPADDRRVHQTIERIVDELAVDTFVFRFVPSEVPGIQPLPLGEYEGAFLPCTFWLATALAMAGRTDEAERIVAAAERVAGPLGLFSEGVDVRTREPLGNMPLMFSHVEYIRAVFALSHARLLQRARRLVRRAEQRLRGVLHR
jgi:GH15 family glucan-1,4-alpha-glucosidase